MFFVVALINVLKPFVGLTTNLVHWWPLDFEVKRLNVKQFKISLDITISVVNNILKTVCVTDMKLKYMYGYPLIFRSKVKCQGYLQIINRKIYIVSSVFWEPNICPNLWNKWTCVYIARLEDSSISNTFFVSIDIRKG